MVSNDDHVATSPNILVEATVFSYTAGAWLPARVTSVVDDTRDPSAWQVGVEYSNQDCHCRKTLHSRSQDLILTSSSQRVECVNPCTEIESDYGSDSDHFSCGELTGLEVDVLEEEHDPRGNWSRFVERWLPPKYLYGKAGTYIFIKKLSKGCDGVAYHYINETSGSAACVKFPKWGEGKKERSAFSISLRVNQRKSYKYHLAPPIEILEHVENAPDGMATVWGWGGEESLSSFLRKDKIRECEKLVCLEHMLIGLRRLHSENYVHGDLHSSNVMVSGKKRGLWVNIIDFGDCHACYKNWTTYIRKPEDHMVFWPPELWLQEIVVAGRLTSFDELTVHPSFDIWSVGMLYYQMCDNAGAQLPSQEDLHHRIVIRIERSDGRTKNAQREIEKLISVRGISDVDKKLLLMMLNPDPQHRSTARDVLHFVRKQLDRKG